MSLKKQSRRIVVVLIVVLVVSLSIYFFFHQSDKKEEIIYYASDKTNASQQGEEASEDWYVDIKGEVKKAGIYEVSPTMRVWDAVMLAEGMTEQADRNQVNFSQRVTDEMVIVIPKMGEENPLAVGKQSDQKQPEKINLNKASEAELMRLSGVGQKKAQEIINYREEKGGFQSIDQLKDISGFGEKTVEKLKESICV